MGKENPSYITESRNVAYFCIDMLGKHRRAKTEGSTRYPLPLLRKYSRWSWRVARDDVRARGFDRVQSWKEMVRTWTLLGRALQVDTLGTAQPDPEEVRKSFVPLERCGWAGCMCSVHEPIHKLQPCKGCFRVAYCNKMCQARDWRDGGHKSRCTKVRKRRSRKEPAVDLAGPWQAESEDAWYFSNVF